MKELDTAPEGFHSVKGVAATDEVTSFFKVQDFFMTQNAKNVLFYVV